MNTPITLEQIRAAAERLSNAHNDTSGNAALMQAEIKSAIAPIFDKYKTTLDAYAAAEASAQADLNALLIAAPQLFVKPRSLTVDGVRCGYLKAADSIDWGDDAAVIARIKALLPDQATLLIRTQESLVADALAGLDPKDLVKIGVRTVTGADNHFITVSDNDVEKLTKLVIAAAASRQGEDDKPKVAKGKAKVRVAA